MELSRLLGPGQPRTGPRSIIPSVVNQVHERRTGAHSSTHVGDESNRLHKRKQTSFITRWRDKGTIPETWMCIAKGLKLDVSETD
jgi:hypothetical protein